MKRGLITWDDEATPRAALEARLERAREAAADAKAPAAVIYTDVWRSNQARYLTNFMPYWNRSLLVVPTEGEPVLICGLSPRGYPWIQSVTLLKDIRPGKNLASRLLELASERGWTRVGAVDIGDFPYEILRALERAPIELLPIDGSFFRVADDTERALRKKTARLTRQLVERSLDAGAFEADVQVVATLERAFRRAGFEDLVVRVSDGSSAPRPASGGKLGGAFSVLVAAEYRGHWVQIARTSAPDELVTRLHRRFDSVLSHLSGAPDNVLYLYDLSGSHPFRAIGADAARSPGRLVAVHVEDRASQRFFHGDTCVVTAPGVASVL